MASSAGVATIAVAVATPVAEATTETHEDSNFDHVECFVPPCCTSDENKSITTDTSTVDKTERDASQNTVAEINDAFDLFLSKVSISSFCLSREELDRIRHQCISQTHQRAVAFEELNKLATRQRETETALQVQLKDALKEKSASISKMQSMISDVNESRQRMEELLEFRIFSTIKAKSLEKETKGKENEEEVKEEKEED